MKTALLTICSIMILITSGCQDSLTGDPTMDKTLIGAGVGAGVGALAGGDTESALIGAGVGALAGYVFGSGQEKDQAAQQERNAIRSEMNTVTVWITNSNGSQIPVRLTKSGPNFIGPRGEIYNKLPTEDQLRPVYGF